MTIGISILVAVFSSFVLTMLFAPMVKHMMTKLHAEQSILEYVDNHKGKAGTPTMGGVMFLLSICIVSLVFGGFKSKIMIVMLSTMLAFGLLGFLDDFIKVKFRHNEGLKAYQKIIGQVGIGIIVTLFAYFDNSIGTQMYLPFAGRYVDFGYFYIPFTLFVFLATTNAVNLTDGIDGLATSTTLVYVATFIIVLVLNRNELVGDVIGLSDNTANIVFLSSVFGGLLAFFLHNANRASIFMGDTGSLALGGMVASIAVFTKNTLLIPIIGIMYIVSCISVIIQVLYFKITHGKRIFLMAPFHHHLQYKGWSESKIVALYTVITLLFSIIALVSIV